jgi:hypothetical protein
MREAVRSGEQRGDRANIPDLVVGEPGRTGAGNILLAEVLRGASQRKRQVGDRTAALARRYLSPAKIDSLN